MASTVRPVFCIGEGAQDVGVSLQRLFKRLDVPSTMPMLLVGDALQTGDSLSRNDGAPVSGSSASSVASTTFSGKISTTSTGRLGKQCLTRCSLPVCCHSYIDPCRTCLICTSRIDALFASCEKFLLSLDSHREIVVLCDWHTAFGLWAYDQLLNFFEWFDLRVSLTTVLLKSPLKPCGLENAYCVYVAAKALEYSSAVLIRGINEYLVDSGSADSTQATRQRVSLSAEDVCHMLACDLWPALGLHDPASFDQGQYALFPQHFVTAQCKLIDVRSSLWKSLDRLDKQQQRRQGRASATKDEDPSDIKPIRLLSSNVHHLHLSYLVQHPLIATAPFMPTAAPQSISTAPSTDSVVSNTNASVRSSTLPHQSSQQQLLLASAVCLEVDAKKVSLVPAQWASDGDVTALLGWATRGLRFTVLEESALLPMYSGRQSSGMGSAGRVSRSEKSLPVAVLAMESVYAKADLWHCCELSKQLLASGAYSSRWGPDKYITSTILFNALAIVESYLDEGSVFRTV